MKRLLLCASAALLFCLSSATASADPPPLYVVDVTGPGVDAARLRDAIARELRGEAITVDDPRATSAVGRVSVEASEGTLTVSFRKWGGPVTRTVPRPDDPTRAEATAVLLAGNLARDEAADVLAGLRKPESAAPTAEATSSASAEKARAREADEADRAALRAYFVESERQTHSAVSAFAWAEVAAGTALLAPSLYLLAAPNGSDAARSAGLGGTITGGTFVTIGALGLAGVFDPSDELLLRMDAEGLSTDEVVAAWRERVARQRSVRKTVGTIGLVVGGLAVAAGTTVLFAAGPRADRTAYDAGTLVLGVGFITAALSGMTLAVESPEEGGLRMWDLTHAHPTPAPAPRVGLAPLPGGGGMASFGFSF
jgi:hypothetical protein